MTTMISEVYDALTSAGVPIDKARKAAEAVGGDQGRFDKLETNIDRYFANIELRFANSDARMATLKGEVDVRFTRHDGELLLIKWMMGFVLAFQVAIIGKLLFH